MSVNPELDVKSWFVLGQAKIKFEPGMAVDEAEDVTEKIARKREEAAQAPTTGNLALEMFLQHPG